MRRYVYLMMALSGMLQAERVEYLTPPVISEDTILQKVCCTRPMREGKFNISAEQKGDKFLVHCYGHGGSGCTTSFGSVRSAIESFEKGFTGDKNTPIRVIGKGIIGMTAAIELTARGYHVSGITARELYDIPSWKNAGYFALVSVKTDPEEQSHLAKIGINTFLEYKKIHEGTHSYIGQECIRYVPVYSSIDTESGVEDLEAAGLIPEREQVTLDFGNGIIRSGFVKYMTYFMDTTRIMLQLCKEVERLGIPIELRDLSSFDEVSEEVIFNCSGLGAKELNQDPQMVAVRGHLLSLNEKSGTEHLDYMIYSKIHGDDGQDAYVYMFPKVLQVTEDCPEGCPMYGTLGGTFIPHTDKLSEEELKALDAVEFEKLMNRNKEFFWGK